MSEPYRPDREGRRGMPVWGWLLIGCGCVGVGGFAVIAVMGAILFPVFQQAREKARQASCLSNLKQIGTAMMMYQQDYDGKLPPASNWMGLSYPYLKSQMVYRCPSLASANPPSGGYAFNSNLSGKKVLA